MRDRIKVETWWVIALIAVTAAIYLGSAGIPALLDDADSFYAEVAREMNLRGDWITPYANGIRYLEKPPLFFWLISLSYGVLHTVGAFAARMPTALAVIALVYVTRQIGTLLYGNRAGLLSGLVLATSMGTFLFTRIILPDALFTLFLSLIFYSYLRWKQEDRKNSWLLWMYGFAALAVMAKGLIGLVFPAGILFLTLVINRNWSDILRLISIKGILLLLAITAPWHILIGIRNPGFFWFYFINEHVLRFLGKRYPMDYGTVRLAPFWAGHMIWLFPWSIYLLTLLDPGTFRRRLAEYGENFILPVAWALTILLFFSFSSRLEYYTVPAFPALALICGAQCSAFWERGKGWPGILLGILGGTAGLSMLIAALFVSSRGAAQGWLKLRDNPDLYAYYLGHLFDLTWESLYELRLPLLIAGIALGVFLPLHLVFRRWEFKAAALGLGMATFFIAANIGFSIFAPRLTSKPVAEEINRRVDANTDPIIVIDGEYEEGCSVAFYTGRNVMLHNGRSSNLEYGSRYADAPPVFPDDEALKKLWNESGKRVFLVTYEPKLAKLDELIPQNRFMLFQYGDKRLYSNKPD
jgi:4-amino-4-deoxy-L-arabinose transferase-like glycosyltransferase